VVVSVGAEERAAPYLAALRAVGLDRVTVLAPGASPGDGAAALAGAAGLVLCGGLDVEPRRYGERPRAGAEVEVEPARDELEWELLGAAREARLPVWAICRGLQVLNVFLGGTLWQDLPSERPSVPPLRHGWDDPPEALAHAVEVCAPRTALGGLLAGEPALVNSRHHQGVRELAPALTAVAVAPDGLVEAVELADTAGGWWVRAVQWHPENLLALDLQRALWRDFARVVGEAARARHSLAGPAAG
jgi:putative glutamine amidotransferase